MCFNFKLFYILLLLYDIVECKPKELRCPEYCMCDIHFGLKRATCQNKKLISVEIDMPPQAEILDISHNQISQLGKNIFLEIGLTNLKLLNMSYNKLSQVHFQGVEGLSELKTLDLSYNMLKYFLDHWWVSLNNLEELFLAGNLLRSINTEPRLKLNKLRVLDLSFCGIESLNKDIFMYLPNLEVLDISKNLLLEFKVDTIKPLPLLQIINLKDNSFECSNPPSSWVVQLRNYTVEHDIRHSENCIVGIHPRKFQRMMMEEEPLRKNGWLYDEENIDEKEPDKVVKCENTTTSSTSQNIYLYHLMRVIDLSPPIFVIFLFVFGFAVGVLFGCTCQVRGGTVESNNEIDIDGFVDDLWCEELVAPYNPKKENSTKNRNILGRSMSTNSGYRSRTRSTGSRKIVREDRNLLLINEYKLSDSTPVLIRKSGLNEV